MPFGDIFTGAFAAIWRHKKLWLFAMIGLALTTLGTMIYGLSTARWMSDYFNFISRMFRNGDVAPESLFGNMLSSMSWIWAGAAVAGLLALLGYIINLVARAAIIHEAAYAWRHERTETGRGLGQGAGRAIYIFLIDLIWWLPLVALVFTGVVAFFVLLGGTVAAGRQDSAGGLIAFAWLAFLCCGACVGILYYLAYMVFSPLMYQSAVAGHRDFGNAVREGWSLARANLGSMIIFWLLLLVVSIVLGLLVQAISFVFSMPLMVGWTRALSDAMQGFGNGVAPVLPTLSGPLMVLVALVSALITFLVGTFTQTLNLTLYGGVYQQLTGTEPVRPPDLGPVEPAEPVAPIPPAAPIVGPVVPPPPPAEDEVPPTL